MDPRWSLPANPPLASRLWRAPDGFGGTTEEMFWAPTLSLLSALVPSGDLQEDFGGVCCGVQPPPPSPPPCVLGVSLSVYSGLGQFSVRRVFRTKGNRDDIDKSRQHLKEDMEPICMGGGGLG